MRNIIDRQARIFFAGDFCSKPSTSVITVSDELRAMIQSCDLNVVNFEVPLRPEITLPKQKRERFFQNDDAPGFLRGLGFNLFSLANNHTFDWGEEGFKKTKAALGDAAIGAGTYEEADRVKVMEVKGLRIGFLAVSFAAYNGVFDDVTSHEGLGCAYINDLCVNHSIIEAKKHVDYLFVLPHDGIEYIDVPLPETIARYHDFIDYGADGVIATHPHCPQGWEEYRNRPIFYSLGNFLFNSKEGYDFRASQPHWYEGLGVIININGGILSWEVVNTRNVNNVSIIYDSDEARNENNKQLCHYLKDDMAYQEYLQPVLIRQANADMQSIKRVFFPKNSKEAIMLLLLCLRGNKPASKDEFLFLMKNDLKRNRIIRYE